MSQITRSRPAALLACCIAAAFALSPLDTAAQSRPPTGLPEMQLSFAPVVEATAPAVVSIYARRVVSEQVNPFADDPFFSQFFQGLGQGLGGTREQAEDALGSGVILAGGLVVSNYHVVGEASEIRVVLADRREFMGRLVLADEAADLAVMALDGAGDLPALELADSDAVRVGDLVLAIGNPFGVGQTVSSGIVSGLARTGATGGGISSGRYFIQTDAPINPGNSGGALVDMRGRLVGINTRILTRTGGSNGIGFAIPANLVAQVAAQAADGADRFTRPWSGLDGQVVTQDIAHALGLEHPQGVLVRDLHSDSPFGAAGLRPGDVLLSLNGSAVNAVSELDFLLATHPLGSEVGFEYLRGGERLQGDVTLIAAPDAADTAQAALISVPGPFQGLTLAPLSASLAADLGLGFGSGAVVVLDTGTLRGRFQKGDVILSVNNRPTPTPDALAEVAKAGARWWRVEYIRSGRRVIAQFNR